MAGSTLYTLLVKLGFDITSLKAGGKDAQAELAGIGQAAKLAAANASPAASAINNMARAANAVAGSGGATTVLQNLAGAADKVLVSTRGSAAALNSVTSVAAKLATATGSGSALNNYSRSVMAISDATKGSVAAITNFTKGVNNVIASTGGAVAPLNRYMNATVAAAQGATTHAEAIQAVAMAARGSAPSLAQAAGATAEDAAATAGLGNAAGKTAAELRQEAAAAKQAAAAVAQMSGESIRGTRAVKEIGEAATATATKAGFMQRTLSMAFAFGGGVAVTTAIGFIGNALLGFNSRLQQAHIAFTTLLGNSGDADKFIKQMENFANVTPFDFQGVVESTQRLLAMGFTAEQVLPTLRAVGDAVAGLGGSTDKLDRVTIALGQMMTAGRVNAQDMRQLTEAGIPAWQMLADAIHKTLAETRDMAEKGLIPSSTAIPAILEGMDKKFSGLMAKQARTAQGAFSTIRDAALQTISGAIEPLFNLLSQGLASIADFFIAGGGKYLVPLIHAIGIAIAVFLIPRMVALAGTIEAITVSFFGLSVPIIPLIAGITLLGIAWQENFAGMQTVFGPIVKGLTDLAGAALNLALTSGLLVPILTVVVTLIGVNMAASLAAMAGRMVWGIATTLLLSGAFTGLTVTAEAATAATATLLGPFVGLVALLGGPGIVAISLFVAAFVLLTLNIDRVGQGFRVLELIFVSTVEGLLTMATWLPIVGDSFKGLRDSAHEAGQGIVRDMAAAEDAINKKQAMADKMATGGASGGMFDEDFQKLLASFKTGASGIASETQKLVDLFGTSMDGVVLAAKDAGGAAMDEMAKAIRAKQNAPVDALKALHELVRNQLEPTAEIARLIGEMTSADMAAGLDSKDPAVYAAAVALKKTVTERLDELTDGAYSAGQNTTIQLAAGMQDPGSIQALSAALAKVGGPIASWIDSITGNSTASDVLNNVTSALDKVGHSMKVSNDWNSKYKPTADAVTAAQKAMNDELEKTARSQGLSALNTAFSEISQAAHKFFDQMHADNLKLIDDALKHKNALLDAKAALNQAPVTAAQKALDFQRRQIEEWRLRQAVGNAKDPAGYRDAVLALQDFLAQQHINDMQSQVDAAAKQIDAQKSANEAKAAAQKAAEDERYRIQSESFDHQLEQLRRYLEKHPGMWQNTQDKIIQLLNGYGISYKNAGSSLGAWFVAGLQEQVAAAQAAAKAMADIIPTYPGSSIVPSPQGHPLGGPIPMADGSWRIMKDNLLASLHQDELVAPADVSDLLRSFGSKKLAGGGPSSFRPLTFETGGGNGGGGTIVFQVGDEVLGEAVDKGLSVQAGVRGNHRRVSVSQGR